MKQVNLTRKKFKRGDEEMCDPRGEGEETNDVKKRRRKENRTSHTGNSSAVFFPGAAKKRGRKKKKRNIACGASNSA